MHQTIRACTGGKYQAETTDESWRRALAILKPIAKKNGRGALVRRIPKLVVGSLLVMASALASGELLARTIRVVSDDNFPPYIFRENGGEAKGYLVDLWQLWEKKTGTAVELVATN